MTDVYKRQALYMKEVFAENKVDVAVLGCYQNLATPDEAALKDTIDTYKRHIVFASLLGAGVVDVYKRQAENCWRKRHRKSWWNKWMGLFGK